jgi:hypothetical protein
MVIGNKLINDPCEPQKDGQDFIRTAWLLKWGIKWMMN